MKKIFLAAVLIAPFLSIGQAKMPFKKNSEKTTFVPFIKKGYHPQIGVALLTGMQNFSSSDFTTEAKSSSVVGVEISLQCPLLCTRKNYVRQQISLMSQNHEGIKTFSAELNPHYRFIAKSNYDIGVGPSLGLIFANINNANKTVFSYGLGASGAYYFNHFFVGADARYAITGKTEFMDKDTNIPVEVELTNLRYVLKLGYKF